MSKTPDPHDESSFLTSLTDLIADAYHNGTSPEGAWKCTIDGNGDFHWDVQITRVQYDGDDD